MPKVPYKLKQNIKTEDNFFYGFMFKKSIMFSFRFFFAKAQFSMPVTFRKPAVSWARYANIYIYKLGSWRILGVDVVWNLEEKFKYSERFFCFSAIFKICIKNRQITPLQKYL